MKTCNNCSTVNDEAVMKCTQCNMPNNFTFQGMTVATPHEKKDTILCSNCGNVEPGNGTKCIHCRFPLPAQPGSANTLSSGSALILRVDKHSASDIQRPASSIQ